MCAQFHVSPSLGSDLCSILPAERVSQRPPDRLIYSRDMWPKTLLAVRDNKPSVSPPDYVVWPESTEEVAEVVRVARKAKAPLIPWGGGSGVCGGAMAVSGGIILDLKRMDVLQQTSAENQLARAQCGINGQTLEDQLNLRGLTLGHFPASIYISTLGGWLAARSAGQMSSKYGKIEDMVKGLTVVLGDGRILTCEPDQHPDLMPLFVGSEGTLGVITEASLRVHPLPDFRIFRAYQFPQVQAGCDAMRRVMQQGVKPAVMRLYDEADTMLAHSSGQGKGGPAGKSRWRGLTQKVAGSWSTMTGDLKHRLFNVALTRAGAMSRLVEQVLPRVSGGCMAIVGFEGEPELAEAEAAITHAEFVASGGEDLGEEPGLSWYKRRYAISYKQSPLYAETDGFVDTMEVAATWDRIPALYQEVRQAISSHAMVLAHFSHAYPEGCSIYFTFAAAAEGRAKAENLYDEIWRVGLTAALKAGGTISHHHGVGLSKAAYMAEEHGASLAVYKQLKTISDPDGILNPGKMGL